MGNKNIERCNYPQIIISINSMQYMMVTTMYFTEKSPSGILIFSNLNNLCPFVTTTLPVKLSICAPEDKFSTLNINSVKSSITGLLGSYLN
jgi:hypothetical protein